MRERLTFSIWNLEQGTQEKLVSDFGQTLNPDQSHFSPFRVTDSDPCFLTQHSERPAGPGVLRRNWGIQRYSLVWSITDLISSSGSDIYSSVGKSFNCSELVSSLIKLANPHPVEEIK